MTLSLFFFFASRRRHTRWPRDWSSDVCSSDLLNIKGKQVEVDIKQELQEYDFGHKLKITPSKLIAPSPFRNDRKPSRSEERRVGKECRSRWSRDQYKTKQ